MNLLTARTSDHARRAALIGMVTLGALTLLLAALPESASPQAGSIEPGLVAHEWGTFTSIAGSDGQALEWLPLTPSAESPKFVHRDLLPLNGLPGFVYHRRVGQKFGLAGTIRMETPVLYFYSNRDLALSVRVSFAKGLITEWYPRASDVTPTEAVNSETLSKQKTDGSIAWATVTLEPGSAAPPPREAADSRYYSARNTASTPLRVSTPGGEEHEKFLFYRGVSATDVPISARFREDGNLVVKSSGKEAVANIILLERRGERFGFRLVFGPQVEAILEPPELTSSIDTLAAELEGSLVSHGLYPDEAHAMLETWNDSWFEEGSRLIYIVPGSYLDTILPLAINPLPAQTVRVFVGRVELISPATQDALKNAIVSHDHTTLRKYCRFLTPILNAIEKKDPAFVDLASVALDNGPCDSQNGNAVQPQAGPPTWQSAPRPCPVTHLPAGARRKKVSGAS